MTPALQIGNEGWDVTLLPVDGAGRVHLGALADAMRDDTALVTVMHANNEVGTVQDIAGIANVAHARGALVHTDAAQSVGKLPVDVSTLGVVLLTVSGHKFYATKGVGALYVHHGTPVAPVTVGADHEHGLRPGTLNVPAIIGLGEAAGLARARLPAFETTLRRMRELLHRLLADGVPRLVVNGHAELRLPNTLNVSFPGVSGRELLRAVEHDVAASVGSACHSGTGTVSGVLAAMGIGVQRALGGVGLSTGLQTTEEDIRHAAQALITRWRDLSRAQ